MNIKDIRSIFTDEELALIDAGKYTPGRTVLDAKLDLAVAMEREACAKVCESTAPSQINGYECADLIRNRGNT